MRALMKRAALVLGLALATAPLAACDDDDGPFEEAGEDVDDAVEDIGR